jgi:hypothetical protein
MSIIINNSNVVFGPPSIITPPPPPPLPDPDATAFLTAAGITDPTISSAIDTLVKDLKTTSIWGKLKAVYPIVGDNSLSHSINLKTPGVFDLTFFGGWTHTSTGALPNGVNTYMSTGIFMPTNLSKTNCSFGVYLTSPYISNIRYHFGYTEGSSLNNSSVLYAINTQKNGWILSFNTWTVKSGLNTNTHQGFWGISRLSLSDFKMINSDGSILTNTNTDTSTTTVVPIIFAARGDSSSLPALFDNMRHSFNFVSEGLTDTELINFRTIVINFQTTLGRQV